MKRIVGTVVALAAVLGFSTVSNAALITYNVGGASGGSLTTVSSVGVFVSPFSAGSTVGVNTDTNGDLVEGDVSLTGGTLYIIGITDLTGLGLGTLTTDVTVTLSGGTGVLAGGDILWDASTTSVATAGTIVCTGAICGFFQDGMGGTWVEGVVYPIALYQANNAASNNYINPSSLGTWDLDGNLLVGSSNHVLTTAISNGAASSWYNYRGVPEPGAFALVLLGLGGLALRSRKAA